MYYLVFIIWVLSVIAAFLLGMYYYARRLPKIMAVMNTDELGRLADKVSDERK